MAIAQEWLEIQLAERSRGNLSWESLEAPFTPSANNLLRILRSSETQNAQRSRQTGSQSVAIEWLQEALAAGPDRYDIDHLARVISWIESQMRTSSPLLLQQAISAIPFELVSPQISVAVLRVAAPVLRRSGAWTRTIDRVRQALVGRGLDGARVLRGLV